MRQLLRRFSSYIAMSSYEVKHNVKGREFYITLEKGIYSRIVYVNLYFNKLQLKPTSNWDRSPWKDLKDFELSSLELFVLNNEPFFFMCILSFTGIGNSFCRWHCWWHLTKSQGGGKGISKVLRGEGIHPQAVNQIFQGKGKNDYVLLQFFLKGCCKCRNALITIHLHQISSK